MTTKHCSKAAKQHTLIKWISYEMIAYSYQHLEEKKPNSKYELWLNEEYNSALIISKQLNGFDNKPKICGFDVEILNENVKFHLFGKNKCSDWFRFEAWYIGGVWNWWMEKPVGDWNFQVCTFETHRKLMRKWFSSTNLIFNACIVIFIRDATQMLVWAVSFVTVLNKKRPFADTWQYWITNNFVFFLPFKTHIFPMY